LPTSRRQGGRPRTIPEQVADDLAVAIMQGQYRAGERVLEQEISELYGVSRGPVREAIRALEKRGLVEFFPRRGAYVVGVSLDLFADLFNVRAALIGMAARCLAVSAPQDALEDLTRRITQLKSCTAALDPMAFATEVGGVTRALYSRCGNVPLGRILHDQQENSLWGLVWRAQALDFHTLERRQQSAQDWSAVASAIGAGNANKAERLTREAMARSRNMALSTLAQLKGETVHPDKLFKDGNVSR
jgi:DNA-binding GntR family transcriptional regulator